MISKKALNALKIISERLEGIPWILTGSTSLAIRGVEVDAKDDIDIITSEEHFFEIKSKLREYITKDYGMKDSSYMKSYWCTFTINDVNVDVMANVQHMKEGKHPKKHHDTEDFEYQGMKLKVLPLKKEHKAYLMMGRKDKADKIKEKLKSSKPKGH